MVLNQPVPPYVKIDSVQPTSRARELGVPAFEYGPVTLDEFNLNSSGYPVPFKYLYITTGGTLVVEQIDGTAKTMTVPDNIMWPVVGFRVLTGTTEPAGITWFGGLGGYNP